MRRVEAVFSVGQSELPSLDGLGLAERFEVPHFVLGGSPSSNSKHIKAAIREQIRTEGVGASYVFLVSDAPLRLLQLGADSMFSLSADLTSPTLNYRRLKGGGKKQMLAKAVGLSGSSHVRVIDATAGLGRDAFILASLGASLQMVERVPEVRALLADALERARKASATQPAGFAHTISRLSLEGSDAFDFFGGLTAENRPDVIYLDPMFPPRQKSALVKKEMRVLHDLVGSDSDAGRLLCAARDTGVRRIVVKRPRLAPTLADLKPSYALLGKSNRFDIYLKP